MKKILLVGVAVAAFATGATAADLSIPRSAIPSAFSWTGFYLGAHIGYGAGRTTWTDAGQSLNVHANGAFGGLQAGYNWQFNSMVIGLEGDIAAAGINGSQTNAFGVAGLLLQDRTTMLASLRARAGFAADRTLFYVTGGLGFATNNHAAASQGVTFTSNANQAGWTVGGGIEHAFTPNWTVKAEYLYYSFGTRDFGSNLTPTLRTDIHTVKLGVNYLFSTGPSAVVARY
jgi:outer membrane immunogenic protein